jgi:hypothetical protein
MEGTEHSYISVRLVYAIELVIYVVETRIDIGLEKVSSSRTQVQTILRHPQILSRTTHRRRKRLQNVESRGSVPFVSIWSEHLTNLLKQRERETALSTIQQSLALMPIRPPPLLLLPDQKVQLSHLRPPRQSPQLKQTHPPHLPRRIPNNNSLPITTSPHPL